MVQLFIEVSDMDAVISKAEKLGASVIVPKSMLPDGDAMAVLQDPTGLSFGICFGIRSGQAKPYASSPRTNLSCQARLFVT